MAFFFAQLTPKQTLENIDTLERKYGFNDALFRNIHHWGTKRDLSGSLEKHIEYLKGPSGKGRSRYQNSPSKNNYIVAQRIEYIVNHATTKDSLGKLIVEAREKYPFIT